VYACGCYHRLYPLDRLEEAARAEHGEAVVDGYSLIREVDGKIDPIIPETAGSFDLSDPHPRVYVRSGFHLIAAVTFGDEMPWTNDWQTYELLPDESLQMLPWGEETVSFFDRDGLVRGADRPEATLLYPSGMYHPGTPRIRGMHLVHFDQYDYDNPSLLEEMLRLPTEGGALRDLASYPGDDSSRASGLRADVRH
jgi:hypothetical protein